MRISNPRSKDIAYTIIILDLPQFLLVRPYLRQERKSIPQPSNHKSDILLIKIPRHRSLNDRNKF